MAVAPETILQSAIALEQGDAEIDWRNACSRAYYAAFHRCRAIAREIEPHTDVEGGSAHNIVADILTSPRNTPVHRGMGYKLRSCSVERKRADYDIEVEFRRKTCQAVIDDCKAIMREAAG